MERVPKPRQRFGAPLTHSLRSDGVAALAHPPLPDGSAIDEDGHLWNAEWDGWRIVRYTPEGTVDRVVEMPVQRPTSCMFGGPDLSTVFVTSASRGLTPDQLAQQPGAGGLFALATDTRGIPETRFGGRF